MDKYNSNPYAAVDNYKRDLADSLSERIQQVLSNEFPELVGTVQIEMDYLTHYDFAVKIDVHMSKYSGIDLATKSSKSNFSILESRTFGLGINYDYPGEWHNIKIYEDEYLATKSSPMYTSKLHGEFEESDADEISEYHITLIKVGSAEFRPSPADLEAYREVWESHDEETEVLTDQDDIWRFPVYLLGESNIISEKLYLELEAINAPDKIGVTCKMCNDLNQYCNEPNQPDGSHICYGCRNRY